MELNLKFKILQQYKIKEALLSLGCQKNQITALENIPLATEHVISFSSEFNFFVFTISQY